MDTLFQSNFYLEKAIDCVSLRQTCISNNLAHVTDDQYRPQEVDFESGMAEALQNMNHGKDEAETRQGEAEMADLEPTVSSAPTSHVDMAQEMASLARSQILYNCLAKQVGGYYSSLKYVIDNTGGR